MRGVSECCHYDEGYDDGYEDGKDERGFERNDAVEAIRALARRWLLAGRLDDADLLDRAADEIERDSALPRYVEAERQRVEKLAKVYATERAAA